ncbi:MAG TPA: sulfatase-like hydrolase/transferase, partial [Planctomycetota bacterium]|nr:sulfatase-like hydrolase/transferase [Planctomycetota bacterium]
TIDTLRRDHVSCYGYSRATTPTLDRLASEGVVFDHASTPRAKTTPALASLFSGAYPHDHGVRDLLQPIAPGLRPIPMAFTDAGYRCAAIVGNFVLQDRYCGLRSGFHAYIESLPSKQGVPPDDVAQRTAKSMTQAGLVALGLERAPAREEDGPPFEPRAPLVDPARPWFLWMHYMDPHGAYEPPEEHRIFHAEAPRWIDPRQAATTPERKTRISEYNVPASARGSDGRIDAAAVVDLYDGEIHYADAELGRLLEALRTRGDLARTWVIVTADHGESLGEQDYWFEHGFYAFESTCAIPMIVRPPDDLKNRPAPGRRASLVSLTDLGATIPSWLELPWNERDYPPNVVRGICRPDLLREDDLGPRESYSEKVEGADRTGTVQIKAVRQGRWKLIRRFANMPGGSGGQAGLKWLSEELYDLDADPLESRDLSALPPTDAPLATLRGLLMRFAACDKPFTAQIHADPEAIRALKALGY